MRQVRICQLITELGPAGAERAVYELARRLDFGRFDVQVVALRGGAVEDWLRDAGVPTTVLGVRGKWDVFKIRKLIQFLRREQFDILHTHLFHADFVGRIAARRAKTPHLVHTVHTAEARFRPWQFTWGRVTRKMCDRIIAVSDSARDFHARRSGLDVSRYSVIRNGIEPDAYARDECARQRLRTQWNVGLDEVLLAFVGRLSEEKGVETLLEAMRELERRGEAPKLVIAGDGPRRSMVEQFVVREPVGEKIRALGFTSDVRGVLSAADVLVAPSRWEGFGLAAAEAMGCSLPVIATRVAGLRDLVVQGDTGLLIDVEDVAALQESIRTLSGDADLRKRLGEAGRKRVQEDFHIDANIAAHEALYSELVGS